MELPFTPLSTRFLLAQEIHKNPHFLLEAWGVGCILASSGCKVNRSSASRTIHNADQIHLNNYIVIWPENEGQDSESGRPSEGA
jgi:hypothetical protein